MRKRLVTLAFASLALFASGWFTIFFQRKQHLIGGGINRIFLLLLINAHLILSIILLYLIIRQSIKLATDRRRRVPGSAFKQNLFFAFIIFSVIPVIFVSFLACKLIRTSIDTWFQARLGRGLEMSLQLHELQTSEQRKKISSVGEKFCERLKNDGPGALKGAEALENFSDDYKLGIWHPDGTEFYGSMSDEVHVWRNFRKLNDRSTKSLRVNFFEKLKSSNAKPFDFYGSLYWVKRVLLEDKPFLFVVAQRYRPEIRYPLIELQNAITDYSQLKSIGGTISWSYRLTFLLIAFLILFLAIWCAFYLARGISKPIEDLLIAIRKVRGGDFDVQVDHGKSDDLKLLVSGFNDMISSLQRAYRHLEFHNKEMLTMLENIKESVFFVNNYGRILSYNATAKKLVANYLQVARFKNRKINFLGPRVKEIFFSIVRDINKNKKTYLSKEITFSHDGEQKTFMVYVTVIQSAVLEKNNGLLIVVDDLTEVYKINKIKTWQEAARQMAHEIKNPLTPIQLATQRLQRKLRKSDQVDPALMDCTETILRQVKIIKSLVSHFSEFAKMPGTAIESLDINKIVQEVVALYKVSYPEITFSYDLHKFLPAFKSDRRKLKRVVVNLLDNSVRALQGQNSCEKKIISIKTNFRTGRSQIELVVADNGPGISRDVKEKLFMPYVSSEKKNMGLGLAIVHEIVTNSGGSIKLLNSSEGASFRILLPV